MIMVGVLEKEYMETVIRMGRRMNNGEIDWEQRRYEIAKRAMAAVMSNPDIAAGLASGAEPVEDVPTAVAKISLTFADALIAKLKKNPVKE